MKTTNAEGSMGKRVKVSTSITAKVAADIDTLCKHAKIRSKPELIRALLMRGLYAPLPLKEDAAERRARERADLAEIRRLISKARVDLDRIAKRGTP